MDAGQVTGGRAGSAGVSSTAGSGGIAGMSSRPADAGSAPDANVDAGTGELDAGATEWWERASFVPVDWSPGECGVSVVTEPEMIGTLDWTPMMLGDLAGETPVVPLGHFYAELADGTSWTAGWLPSGESVVAVRDPNGAPLLGFKQQTGCQFQLARTDRGLCALFLLSPNEPAALACGDLLAPDPLFELAEGGFIVANSDELLLVRGGFGHDIRVIDLSDDSVTVTTVAGHSYGAATASGREAFVIYQSSEPVPWRGILFGWNGAAGYEPLHDPLPLGIVNVHTDGDELVWTEAEVRMPRTGTSIYRAALPLPAGSLAPMLVREIDLPAQDNWSALGAGYLAIQIAIRIELIRITDGERRRIEVAEPWLVTGQQPFINERTLGFQLFDKNDSEQRWVTFRANLSDVLALPSD